MDINLILPNPNNPRSINDKDYQRLLNSIKEFPEMLSLKPIIINASNVILCGNMRYRAALELGYTEIPVIVANNLTVEQEQELLIKDNLNYGEWDWDVLANEWDLELLEHWGLDVMQPVSEKPIDQFEENDFIGYEEDLEIYKSEKQSKGKFVEVTPIGKLAEDLNKAKIRLIKYYKQK